MEKETLHIVKVGGQIIDHQEVLSGFLDLFAELQGYKILVHGGGKLATRLAANLNIPQQMIDGRRITDKDTLNIVVMVYAGLINKQVVAQLQGKGCGAIGLCGADAGIIRAQKRSHAEQDFGFVGDVESIDANALSEMLAKGLSPVIAPITHDGRGQLLNTNADTIAQEMAKAMSMHFHTVLIYSFEKAGVLLDTDDETSVIPVINRDQYRTLKENGRIFAGMIPKLDNAFQALEAGVGRVVIGPAEQLPDLVRGSKGTRFLTWTGPWWTICISIIGHGRNFSTGRGLRFQMQNFTRKM
jgi:acetylglutamate kinase